MLLGTSTEESFAAFWPLFRGLPGVDSPGRFFRPKAVDDVEATLEATGWECSGGLGDVNVPLWSSCQCLRAVDWLLAVEVATRAAVASTSLEWSDVDGVGKGNTGTAMRRTGVSLSFARRKSHSRIATLLTYNLQDYIGKIAVGRSINTGGHLHH